MSSCTLTRDLTDGLETARRATPSRPARCCVGIDTCFDSGGKSRGNCDPSVIVRLPSSVRFLWFSPSSAITRFFFFFFNQGKTKWTGQNRKAFLVGKRENKVFAHVVADLENAGYCYLLPSLACFLDPNGLGCPAGWTVTT